MLDSGRRAAERKDEGAAKIESDQQRIYNDFFAYNQIAYAASQASAATTSASTPVSKVG